MENYEERYIATMVLHALGDTIGFKNSEWEFMKTKSLSDNVMEKVYEFVHLGGVNNVPQKGWNISDDTLMHIQVAKTLLSNYSTVSTFCSNMVNEFLDVYKTEFSSQEGINKRRPGIRLLSSLKKLNIDPSFDNLGYNYYSGGSGASMRSSCIGLAYYGINNRNELIKYSIESSRVTHNSAIGYLGGMVAALFTAYAMENKDIKLWPYLMMDLFKNDTINKYIETSNRDYNEYKNDVHTFINKWSIYMNHKFNDDGSIIYRRSTKNLVYRTNYYYDNFGFHDKNNEMFPGSGGDDSVIIAYDALLDSEGNWEKLIFYAMLHGGDTDTTGCIAASWYGAIYGYGDVPLSRIDILENKGLLEDLGKKLFIKYFNK